MYSITSDIVDNDPRDVRVIASAIADKIKALGIILNRKGCFDKVYIDGLPLYDMVPFKAAVVFLAYQGICTQRKAAALTGLSNQRISQIIHKTARRARYESHIDYKENLDYQTTESALEISQALRVGLGPRPELTLAALCPSEWKVVIAYHPKRGPVAAGVQRIEVFTQSPVYITHDVPDHSAVIVFDNIVEKLEKGFAKQEELFKLRQFLAPLRHQ